VPRAKSYANPQKNKPSQNKDISKKYIKKAYRKIILLLTDSQNIIFSQINEGKI